MMRRVGPLLFLLGVIGLWWLVAALALISPVFLAGPWAAMRAMVDGLVAGDLLMQLRETVWRMLLGWLVASGLAVVLGGLIGLSASARALLLPSLDFLRPLPASAIIPLAVALLGLGPGMVLSVVVFGSVWPTLLATVQGFGSVPAQLQEVCRCLQMSRLAFAWKIGLRNALPDILAGMRLSLTVALILAITCEMIAGEDGLGTAVMLAARSFRADELFAGIILLGVVGYVSNMLLEFAEWRLLRWQRTG